MGQQLPASCSCTLYCMLYLVMHGTRSLEAQDDTYGLPAASGRWFCKYHCQHCPTSGRRKLQCGADPVRSKLRLRCGDWQQEEF